MAAAPLPLTQMTLDAALAAAVVETHALRPGMGDLGTAGQLEALHTALTEVRAASLECGSRYVRSLLVLAARALLAVETAEPLPVPVQW